MKNSEFREGIRELVNLIDFPIIPTPNDICWFDGGKCPYGLPEGKFQLRPTQFCHLDAHGCHKLPASMADFESDFGVNGEGMVLALETIKQILTDKVPELIDKNGLLLSEILKDISSDNTESFSTAERKILELAADILAASGSSADPKVITENFDSEGFDL